MRQIEEIGAFYFKKDFPASRAVFASFIHAFYYVISVLFLFQGQDEVKNSLNRRGRSEIINETPLSDMGNKKFVSRLKIVDCYL